MEASEPKHDSEQKTLVCKIMFLTLWLRIIPQAQRNHAGLHGDFCLVATHDIAGSHDIHTIYYYIHIQKEQQVKSLLYIH